MNKPKAIFSSIIMTAFSAVILVFGFQNCGRFNVVKGEIENGQLPEAFAVNSFKVNDVPESLTDRDCVVADSAWSVDSVACRASGLVVRYGTTRFVENQASGVSGSIAYSCGDSGLEVMQRSCFQGQSQALQTSGNVQAASSAPAAGAIASANAVPLTLRYRQSSVRSRNSTGSSAPVNSPTTSPVSPGTSPSAPSSGSTGSSQNDTVANSCATASAFPQRLTISGNGAVCGITLSGVLSLGSALPKNNEGGFSYPAAGLSSDAIPGTGRICLVCRNNQIQVSSDPGKDCRSYTNASPQSCAPKTCEVPEYYAWSGKCSTRPQVRSLNWGEELTLENTDSRATSGSVKLRCGGESGLQGYVTQADAECETIPSYSHIEDVKVDKTQSSGMTAYNNSILEFGNITFTACTSSSSNDPSRRCERFEVPSSNFTFTQRRTYVIEVPEGRVGFSVGYSVRVVDPYGPGTQGGPYTLINSATSTGLETGGSEITLHDFLPDFQINQRTIDAIKNDSRYREKNIDISGLLGKTVMPRQERVFTFQKSNIGWK